MGWKTKPPRGAAINYNDPASSGLKVAIHCFPDSPPVDLISGVALSLIGAGGNLTFGSTYDGGVMSNALDGGTVRYYRFTDAAGLCDPGNNSFAFQWDGYPTLTDLDEAPSGVGACACGRDFGAGVASWHMQVRGGLSGGVPYEGIAQVEAEFPDGSNYVICGSNYAARGGSSPAAAFNDTPVTGGGPFRRCGFMVPTGLGGTPAWLIDGTSVPTFLINSTGGAVASWQGVKASAQTQLVFGSLHEYGGRDGYFMAGFMSRFLFWSPAPTLALMQDIGNATDFSKAYRYMVPPAEGWPNSRIRPRAFAPGMTR